MTKSVNGQPLRVPDWEFQDTTVYSANLAELERVLFPGQGYIPRTSYYGCVTNEDSLILYLRVQRPNVDSALALTRRLAFDSTSKVEDIDALNLLAEYQCTLFQREWEAAFRQSETSRCQEFTKNLRLIFALEECLKAIYSFHEYPGPSQYFEFLWNYRKNETIVRYKYYWDFAYSKGRRESGFTQADDEWLASLTSADIDSISNEYMLPELDYLTWLRRVRNRRGWQLNPGRFGEWEFYSPMLPSISSQLVEVRKQMEIIENGTFEKRVYSVFLTDEILNIINENSKR